MNKNELIELGKKMEKINQELKAVEKVSKATKFTTQLGEEHGILRLYVPLQNAKAAGLEKGRMVDVLIRRI